MLRLFKQYYPIRNVFFVIGEGLIILTCVFLTSLYGLRNPLEIMDFSLLLKAALITLVCQSCLYYFDLYDAHFVDNFKKITIRLLQSIGAASIMLAIIYFIFPNTILTRRNYFLIIYLTIFFIMSWRLIYSIVLAKGIFDKKIIIIGSDELAQKIINEISSRSDCGYNIACIVLERHHKGTMLDAAAPIIRKKSYQGICELTTKLNINTIVVAIKEKRGELPTKELLKCKVGGIDVLEGNSFYEMLTGKLIVEQINPSWLIFSDGFRKSTARRLLKRITDIFLSLFLIVLFFPLLVLVAIFIKLDSDGPIIFSQERVGQGRKKYLMHKFRSMIADAEKFSGPVWTMDDDDRITRVGKVIRKLRIDELPQIWNVLKGEMSLIGPRPERQFFVDSLVKKIPYYNERFTVKPGVTGWAQVSYHYGSSVEDAIEKLNYDLFYIKNLTVFIDLLIALKTIKIVLFGRGAR